MNFLLNSCSMKLSWIKSNLKQSDMFDNASLQESIFGSDMSIPVNENSLK